MGKEGSPKKASGSSSTSGKTAGAGTPKVEISSDVYFPILIAFFLVLVTIVFLWSRKSRKGRSVLFTGPCDAGKTALFSRVVGGPAVQTVTSLVPNELEYTPRNGKPALIIKDLPGHDRVQVKFWESNKVGARGIVCVVDAAAGNKGIREAADVLFRILTDPSVLSSAPAVYVFANKQDLPMSKGMKVIRAQLEKELTTLRMTKSAGLVSTGGKDTSQKLLGRIDKDFDFDHLTQIKIQFGEGSASGSGDGETKGLESLFNWLDSIA